jgi:hypothetical protein
MHESFLRYGKLHLNHSVFITIKDSGSALLVLDLELPRFVIHKLFTLTPYAFKGVLSIASLGWGKTDASSGYYVDIHPQNTC